MRGGCGLGEGGCRGQGRQALKKQLEELKASLKKKKDAPETVTKGVEGLLEKTVNARPEAHAGHADGVRRGAARGQPGAASPEGSLARVRPRSYTGAPTCAAEDGVRAHRPRRSRRRSRGSRRIQQTDVPALNKLVYESGIGKIDAGEPVPWQASGLRGRGHVAGLA